MYIDIHSYIKYNNGQYNLLPLLNDMKKYNIDYRVVGSLNNLSNIEILSILSINMIIY